MEAQYERQPAARTGREHGTPVARVIAAAALGCALIERLRIGFSEVVTNECEVEIHGVALGGGIDAMKNHQQRCACLGGVPHPRHTQARLTAFMPFCRDPHRN
jgi:hypothetical protein